MKAKKNSFDNLTAEQIGKLFPIRIVPYNPKWKVFFEQEKVLLAEILRENRILHIEHILEALRLMGLPQNLPLIF